ncbi:MAG: 4-(cytidine 5'-diphospho)-2-C-methyl-D-erythritol kinase [Clostridia bacterium]|nr:4-(cytidine 5'-diphospho)-2-C-methyl-D-erythritol kinase [Clostridia bacterium]
MSVCVKAPAKINLVLDVVGKREDGYHVLETVFQSVDWYDRITVDYADTLCFTCNGDLPQDASNTAYRAAVLFAEYIGERAAFRIDVEKHIPVQAGLAGGSADAAGTLVALNHLTGAGLSQAQLCDLANKVGADVPFCVMGGTAFATGTGDILTPLPALEQGFFVIVKPEGGVSTPEAYRLVDNAEKLFHPSAKTFCEALESGDVTAMAAAVGNTFEAALSLPACLAARDQLTENGAIAACMSGSGTAVFGWFTDRQTAENCTARLSPLYANVQVCQPCGGVELIK